MRRLSLWLRNRRRAVPRETAARSRHGRDTRQTRTGSTLRPTNGGGGYVGLDYLARHPTPAPLAPSPGHVHRPALPRALRVAGLLGLLGVMGVLMALHARGGSATRRAATPARAGLALHGPDRADRPTARLDHVPVVSPAVAFAAGACIAYRPLRGDRHRTVFIDPGHGGPDPGAEGTTSAGLPVEEKDLTLATARDLLALLRDAGYRVVLSRTGDTSVARLSAGDLSAGALTLAGEHRDTAARIACANAAGAAALVSLHFNTFADPAVGGAETLYDSARPFHAANQRLAGLVQQGIVASLRAAGWDIPDRGVIDDAESGTPALTTEAAAYGHLLELGPAAPGWLARPSAMPGVLCEPLFLSDPAEADVAASAAGQQAIALGLARAITTFVGS